MIKFYKCTFIASFLVGLIGVCCAHDSTIRYINPPKLSTQYLGKKVLCHRPMREGTPAMYIEKKGNVIIAHNYGHGGSGWTLAPGAASYVNQLLEDEIKKSNLNKEIPITIVGAGALGLFTALNLVERGYSKITIVSENFENLTSHNAGGLLAPVSMSNAPDMQKLVDKIGIEAYKFYKLIAQKKHPIIKDGAIVVSTYFETREESGLEPYVGVVMNPAKDVVLDFKNGTQRKMVAYDDGIFMNTPGLMHSLRNALKNKITFIRKKINNFNEIKTPVIINCSGLGGRYLNNDQKMVSVQGHLVMLKNQNPKDINHMILVYYPENVTKSGQKIKRSFYMFPKTLSGSHANDVGVIGGTFIENADASTPNEEEFDIMINGARKFYGIH